MPTQFEVGFLVGLLVGEGHFGGDGRQPHVTLRMHVRHEAIFQWLERTFPGGRVYGPYNHDGRHYFQWMARGRYLRDELAPLLDQVLSPSLDRHSFERYQLMKARYPQLAGDLPATSSPYRRIPGSDGNDGTIAAAGQHQCSIVAVTALSRQAIQPLRRWACGARSREPWRVRSRPGTRPRGPATPQTPASRRRGSWLSRSALGRRSSRTRRLSCPFAVPFPL